MLIRKQLPLIVATLVLALATQARGQFSDIVPGTIGSQATGQGSFNQNSFGADFDPQAWEYDMSPFTPLDVSEYGGGPKSKAGYYARYDRTYMSLSRPDGGGPGNGFATFTPVSTPLSLVIPGTAVALQPGPNSPNVPIGNDFVYGNHFNFGYTDCNGTGWDVDYMKSEGGFYSGAGGVEVQNPAFTSTKLNQLSLNRVFRSDLSRGGYVEPYVGVKYLGVNDSFTQGTQEFALININAPASAVDDVLQFANTRFRQKASNTAVGGHLGMRYSKQHGRWNLGSNMNMSALYNSQRASASTSVVFPTNNLQFNSAQSRGNGNSFVPVLDLGVTSTYEITRDISLRMGAEVIYVWDGLTRVNTLPARMNPNLALDSAGFPIAVTQENMTLAGFSLGIEWRR